MVGAKQGPLADAAIRHLRAVKMPVCHVPPGNPENFHTIIISENALQAHLNHGDLEGSCSDHCEAICSDDSLCTIDIPVGVQDYNCEVHGCAPLPRALVNCDDSNFCTEDSCDPIEGCQSVPLTDGTLCDAGQGQCIDGTCTPLTCPDTYVCPSDGDTFADLQAAWNLAITGTCSNVVTMCSGTMNGVGVLNLAAGQTVTFQCLGEPRSCVLEHASGSGQFFNAKGDGSLDGHATFSLIGFDARCNENYNANYGGAMRLLDARATIEGCSFSNCTASSVSNQMTHLSSSQDHF